MIYEGQDRIIFNMFCFLSRLPLVQKKSTYTYKIVLSESMLNLTKFIEKDINIYDTKLVALGIYTI